MYMISYPDEVGSETSSSAGWLFEMMKSDLIFEIRILSVHHFQPENLYPILSAEYLQLSIATNFTNYIVVNIEQ